MNVFQLFACRYHMKRLRNQFVEDVDNTLKAQLAYQDPDRYREVFQEELAAEMEPLTLAGRPVEEVVDDMDEMDRYFADLENKRLVTGGEVFIASGRGEWQ